MRLSPLAVGMALGAFAAWGVYTAGRARGFEECYKMLSETDDETGKRLS